MFQLSTVANKDEYTNNMHQKVLLGKRVVVVVNYEKDGRTGSWERGFKFTSNKYGGLWDKKTWEVSFDHGVTWFPCSADYQFEDRWKATKKGRLKLSNSTNKEFAFDKIQKINEEYFGPGYKWKP